MAAMRTTEKDSPRTATRQLIDELDALMDRMLALPIEDGDPPAATTTASASMPMVSATLTLLESPLTAGSESHSPAHANEPIGYEVDAAAAAAPVVEKPTIESADVEPASTPLLSDVAAPPRLDHAAPPPIEAAPRWRPDQLSYQFLLWVNQGYDRGAGRLGLVGRALRSRFCRALLGMAGLGLLALGLAWLGKDWLGWNW